jgi:hypothetical protein
MWTSAVPRFAVGRVDKRGVHAAGTRGRHTRDRAEQLVIRRVVRQYGEVSKIVSAVRARARHLVRTRRVCRANCLRVSYAVPVIAATTVLVVATPGCITLCVRMGALARAKMFADSEVEAESALRVQAHYQRAITRQPRHRQQRECDCSQQS